jgi:hypothetical protein
MGNKRNLTEIMYSCTTYPNTELYRRLYPYAEQSGKFLITRKAFISRKSFDDMVIDHIKEHIEYMAAKSLFGKV